jgi:hypothetical protein
MQNTFLQICCRFLLALPLWVQFAQAKNPCSSQIPQPSFFGDNMVLQGDNPVKFWGTASSMANPSLQFAGKTKTVVADKTCNWPVLIKVEKLGFVTNLKIKSDFCFSNLIIEILGLFIVQKNCDSSTCKFTK